MFLLSTSALTCMLAGFLTKPKSALPKSCQNPTAAFKGDQHGCFCRTRAHLPSTVCLGHLGRTGIAHPSHKPQWSFLLGICPVLNACKNVVSAATGGMAPPSSAVRSCTDGISSCRGVHTLCSEKKEGKVLEKVQVEAWFSQQRL